MRVWNRWGVAAMGFILTGVVFAGTVSGQLKVWHKVTVSFDGPQSSEQATPNPFMDYRLDVMFVGPSGRQYNVPGYYAADGNAANTAADAGNQWQVHFAPDEAGQWTYSVSFRTGKNLAVADGLNAGRLTAAVMFRSAIPRHHRIKIGWC